VRIVDNKKLCILFRQRLLIRVKQFSTVVPHIGLNGETEWLYKISTDILFREQQLEKPRR